MIRLRLFVIGIILLIGNLTFLYGQQINVYNYGTLIRIEKDVMVSINGNYTDNSGTSNFGIDPKLTLTLDAPIFLSGTLQISGDIENNSSTSSKLIFAFESSTHTGKIVLTGTSDQAIKGSVDSYFPNLELNKSGAAVLQRDILIDNNLTLTSGSIDLNSKKIVLDQHGTIASETETNHIAGSDGYIETAQYPINPNTTVTDYRGIGLGYATDNQNFSDVVFTREYGAYNRYTVADGINSLRVYRMKTTTTDTFPSIRFYYHDLELANGLADSNLALYYSNNDGLTWTKASGTINTASNIVTALSIPVANGDENLFALAANTCSVGNAPDATISSTADGVLMGTTLDICEKSNLQISVPYTANYYYKWNAVHGNSSTADFSVNNINLTTDDGTYSILVRKLNGCETTTVLTVDVRSIPVAGFSIAPDPNMNALCFGNSILFTDTSVTADNTPVEQWAWTFDDTNNATASTNTSSYTYISTGPKNPSLIVTSKYGCVSPSVSRPIAIETLPVTDFNITNDAVNSITELCEDKDVQLINLSTYSPYPGSTEASTLSYTWTFDDGNTSTSKDPLHVYNTYNTYNIKLRATASTQCYAEVTKPIVIHPEPIPQFTPTINASSIGEACAGVYIVFDNSSTMPGATGMTYSWDFKDGTSSTDFSPQKQFDQEQNDYKVTLTATSVQYGCFESVEVPVIIYPGPKGSFTIADPDVCIGEEVVLTNSSVISSGTISYQWDFNDGNTTTSGLSEIRHAYTDSRQYKVTLQRTSDHGCVNSVSGNVIVHPSPVAAFQFLNTCDQQEASFYNNSVIQSDVIATYLWSYGDNTTSGLLQPSHLFPAYGVYPVTLTATSDYGCSDVIAHSVSVYRKASFNLGASVAGCSEPFIINPQNDPAYYLPAGSTFSWTNSNQQIISTSTQAIVSQSGVYTVAIKTPSPESCDTKINIPLFLFKPAYLGDDIVACSQIVLDAENELQGERAKAQQTLYEWKKNGVVVSSQQVLTISESGDYTVTITRIVAGNSCSSSDDIHVDITLPLTLSLPATTIKCEGETVLLDVGIIAQSYEWTNVNSGEIEGSQRTLLVTESGVYKVKVTGSSCTASAVSTVTFTPPPQVSFDVSASFGCAGQNLVFTDFSFTNVDAISTIEWNFGDLTSATNVSQPSKIYSSPGDYVVTLTATTTAGCSKTYSRTITVKPSPVADFSLADACAGETVTIQNNSLPAGASFAWNFGDETTSDLIQPGKTFTNSGEYTVSLSVSSEGCTVINTQVQTIHALPDVKLGNPITTCGNTLVLDAFNPGSVYKWFDPLDNNNVLSSNQQYIVSSDSQIGLEVVNSFGCKASEITDVRLNTTLSVSLGNNRTVCDAEILDGGYFPGAQYLWNNGENTRMLEASQSGLYSVSIIDQNGCSAAASVQIQIVTTPVVAMEQEVRICDGTQLELTAGTNPSYTYSWTTGATTASIVVNSEATYGVIVSNANCSVNKQTNVTVSASPTAGFEGSSVCAGSDVSFSNTSQWTGNGSLTYVWSFGDGSYSTLPEPVKTYVSASTYSVTLKTKNEENCSAEITKPIRIKDVPVSEFLVADACSNNVVQINNTSSYTGSGQLNYSWNFGNGDLGSGMVPSYSYPLAGSYLVRVQVSSDEGCTDDYIQEIVVGNTPSLNQWQTQVNSCNPSVVLDAGNAGSTYLWGNASTQQTLDVNQSGNYEVTITSPDGCSIQGLTTVDFNSRPLPLLADNTEGCGKVLLDPKVNVASYLWSTGEQSSTITVTSSDVYSVQVISLDLCIAEDATTVAVRPIPTFELGDEVQACVGDVLRLAPTVAIPVTYLWSTAATTPSIDPTASGLYSAVLTSSYGCTYKDSVRITIHALPDLQFDTNIIACGSIFLDAKNTGSTYLWSSGSREQAITATTSGNYTVEVVNEYQCVNAAAMSVTILAVPELELGSNRTVCNEETVTLDAGAAASNYLWSDNSKERYLTAGSTGDYSVTIIDDNGCKASDVVSVTVRPALGLELGADRLLCNNAGIYLNAGVSNVSYQWGSSTGFSSQQKEIRPSQAGIYWIHIEDSYLCSASDTVKVTPTTQNITASFLTPSVVGQGDAVQFAQLTETDAITFLWTFGDGGFSAEKNPTHRYFTEGEFEPTLVVSNGVCTDTLTKSITVRNGRFETKPDTYLPQYTDIVNTNLYPNPSSGIFTIQLLLTAQAEASISIYSLTGVLLAETRKTILEDQFEFDLTSVSEGVYFIRVMVGSKMRVLKVIKAGGN